MNIGTTQSQSLINSMQFSSSTVTQSATRMQFSSSAMTQSATARKSPIGGVGSLDKVEVGTKVDGNFVNRVLQDSLEDRLNSALETAGVEMSAGELLASGMDFSPEATATRIVDFATSFYSAYQMNHESDEGGAKLEGFVTLIKGAVEEGFAGARELLGGFSEMSKEVEDDIDETFDLTMKGIDAFADEQRQLEAQAEEKLQEMGAI